MNVVKEFLYVEFNEIVVVFFFDRFFENNICKIYCFGYLVNRKGNILMILKNDNICVCFFFRCNFVIMI